MDYVPANKWVLTTILRLIAGAGADCWAGDCHNLGWIPSLIWIWIRNIVYRSGARLSFLNGFCPPRWEIRAMGGRKSREKNALYFARVLNGLCYLC